MAGQSARRRASGPTAGTSQRNGRRPLPIVERGIGMTGRVTSVFLYVKDVRRSLEFYNEVVGAEVVAGPRGA